MNGSTTAGLRRRSILERYCPPWTACLRLLAIGFHRMGHCLRSDDRPVAVRGEDLRAGLPACPAALAQLLVDVRSQPGLPMSNRLQLPTAEAIDVPAERPGVSEHACLSGERAWAGFDSRDKRAFAITCSLRLHRGRRGVSRGDTPGPSAAVLSCRVRWHATCACNRTEGPLE